jgi:2-haloacid dehalogenase
VKPQAVIFDIGNVLVGWQPERFYDTVMPQAMREKMFAEVDLHGMNDLIDKGALFKETVYDWADRHPDWSGYVRMWFDNWFDLASPYIDRSIRLQQALRAQCVPVFALTNFGSHSFAHAETRFGFLKDFDRRYISGHMGVTKPDPAIYAMVEADCGIAPGGLLFTDDRPENIAVARDRGWRTHLFEGPDGWADRLVAEGLLTAEEAA